MPLPLNIYSVLRIHSPVFLPSSILNIAPPFTTSDTTNLSLSSCYTNVRAFRIILPDKWTFTAFYANLFRMPTGRIFRAGWKIRVAKYPRYIRLGEISPWYKRSRKPWSMCRCRVADPIEWNSFIVGVWFLAKFTIAIPTDPRDTGNFEDDWSLISELSRQWWGINGLDLQKCNLDL